MFQHHYFYIVQKTQTLSELFQKLYGKVTITAKALEGYFREYNTNASDNELVTVGQCLYLPLDRDLSLYIKRIGCTEDQVKNTVHKMYELYNTLPDKGKVILGKMHHLISFYAAQTNNPFINLKHVYGANMHSIKHATNNINTELKFLQKNPNATYKNFVNNTNPLLDIIDFSLQNLASELFNPKQLYNTVSYDYDLKMLNNREVLLDILHPKNLQSANKFTLEQYLSLYEKMVHIAMQASLTNTIQTRLELCNDTSTSFLTKFALYNGENLKQEYKHDINPDIQNLRFTTCSFIPIFGLENSAGAFALKFANPGMIEHIINAAVGGLEGYHQNGARGAIIGGVFGYFASYKGAKIADKFAEHYLLQNGIKYTANLAGLLGQNYMNTGKFNIKNAFANASIDFGGGLITNFGNMRSMVAEPISWAQAIVVNSHAVMVSAAGKLTYDFIEDQHE